MRHAAELTPNLSRLPAQVLAFIAAIDAGLDATDWDAETEYVHTVNWRVLGGATAPRMQGLERMMKLYRHRGWKVHARQHPGADSNEPSIIVFEIALV